MQREEGSAIADVGAGTGIFTRLFADAVGPQGHVIAVDIAQNFLDHIQQINHETIARMCKQCFVRPKIPN